MKRYILVTFLFLLISLVILCALISDQNNFVLRKDISAVAPLTFSAGKASAANKALLNFPNAIPGAAYINKYVTPDAKYCLVHIRQMHLVSDISEEQKKEVAVVQSDIFDILEYLILNDDLREIYDEGNDDQTASIALLIEDFQKDFSKILNTEELELRKSIDNLEQIIQEIILEAKDTEDDKKLLTSFKEELTIKEGRLKGLVEEKLAYTREDYQYNAVDKAIRKYGIKKFGAEIAEINIKASLAIENLNLSSSLFDEMVLDDREDALLDLISQRSTPLAVTVYGAGHSWGGYESFGSLFPIKERLTKDNIALWNKAHPDKKFSLIEVTPASLE